MRKLCLGLSVAAMVLLCACGDETTTNVTETTGLSVIAKGDKIPSCSADIEGKMIYVADSAESGKPGEGKQGPKGEDGVGTPGASGKSCTAKALDGNKGYKIECDGDSVGVVLNGKDGGPGADGKSFVDGWMVDPRDKQLYRTVTIGDQIWMAENLNYRYLGPTADEDSSSFCYQNDPANCAKYGRLYLWSAAMDSAGIIDGNTANGCGYQSDCSLGGNVRGVCPEGWHLPGYEDWETLIVTVDGSITGYDRDNTAGSKLRSSSGWNNNGNGTDDYRFSALPAGYWADCFSSGHFVEKDYSAYFWSSTEVDSSHPYNMVLGGVFADLNYEGGKCHAFSVRCLKD